MGMIISYSNISVCFWSQGKLANLGQQLLNVREAMQCYKPLVLLALETAIG